MKIIENLKNFILKKKEKATSTPATFYNINNRFHPVNICMIENIRSSKFTKFHIDRVPTKHDLNYIYKVAIMEFLKVATIPAIKKYLLENDNYLAVGSHINEESEEFKQIYQIFIQKYKSDYFCLDINENSNNEFILKILYVLDKTGKKNELLKELGLDFEKNYSEEVLKELEALSDSCYIYYFN